MANKIQIRKFLEKKKEESIEALRKESREKQEAAKDEFFRTWGGKFENIKGKTAALAFEYEKLCNTLSELGVALTRDYYSPMGRFNQLVGQLSITQIRENYITVIAAEKIEGSYLNKIEDCKREWNGLIALCQANSAKDGIIILENLGFDISEIEVKTESTVLITNIDARKLFIVKGADQ